MIKSLALSSVLLAGVAQCASTPERAEVAVTACRPDAGSVAVVVVVGDVGDSLMSVWAPGNASILLGSGDAVVLPSRSSGATVQVLVGGQGLDPDYRDVPIRDACR